MSEFYETPLQSHFDAAHVLFPVLALATLALILWLFRKKLGSREIAFSLVWMCAFLLPVFDLGVFPQGDIVHDRYFYVPSFGASLLLALALDRLSRGAPAIRIAAALAAGHGGLARAALLRHGQRHELLGQRFPDARPRHAFLPNDPILRNHYSVGLAFLGRASYEQHDWATAEMYLQRAAKIDPVAADNYLQLGMVDLNTGRSARRNRISAPPSACAPPSRCIALPWASRSPSKTTAPMPSPNSRRLLRSSPASQQRNSRSTTAGRAQQASRQATGQNTISSLDKPYKQP